MKRLLALTLLCSAPALVHAEPRELPIDAIGPRWLGVQYIDGLGWTSDAPGDLNGDGLSDFVVSSPQDEGPVTFNSVLRIFFGQQDVPESGSADWAGVEITDGKTGGDAVFKFAMTPDLTGDGVRDLLVAEPNATGANDAGKVLLYAGTEGAWPGVITAAERASVWHGVIVEDPGPVSPATRPSRVAAGDLNGDGDADVIIASGLARKIWVDFGEGGFVGERDLNDADDSVTLCGGDQLVAGEFGAALLVGDFNGDGEADLVTSAPGCQGGAGRVFVWYGGAGFDLQQPSLTLDGGDGMGVALSKGDLDDDGIDDLFVHESLEFGGAGSGRLNIFLGGPGGLTGVPTARVLAGTLDRRFGESVTVLADVSEPADGLPELVVGSPGTAGEVTEQGAIYIFEGRDWTGDLTTGDASWSVVGSHRESLFGLSVSALDDFDGDGNPEIVVGEPNFTPGDSENDFRRGRVYLFDALPERDEDGDGVSTLAGDCDDGDDEISPNQGEICDDGVDNDCDREVDEGCGDDDDAADDDDDDTTGIVVTDPNGDCDCSSSVAGSRGGAWALIGFALLGLRRRR